MRRCTSHRVGAVPLASVGLAASILALLPTAAAAQSMQVYSGDTAWLLIATVLSLLMGVPGLAMFYGGLVRTKNALSMFAQVFTVICLAIVLWVLVGYSLAFTGGGLTPFAGGLSKAFLSGVTADAVVPTFHVGVAIPEYAFIGYEMIFACLAPAIIIGAFAERMRFPAMLLFIALWILLVYAPLAHMAWYRVAPDAVAEAARAVAAAAPGAAKRQAEAALAALTSQAGLFQQWGVLDYSGGTAVHISAGIAGLIGAIALGKRAGYGRDSMAPHNLTMTIAGAALLWVGWFGFNAGSGLRADGYAALSVVNTLVAPAAAALSWLMVEWATRGKPSALGLVSGILAGLVAVTPASGYIGPVGAIVLGLVSGGLCFVFATTVKNHYQYDDSLDVFGVHCIAGIVGTLLVAVLASPQLGGTGLVDAAKGGLAAGGYSIAGQLLVQLKGVVVALIWAGLISAQLYWVVDWLVGLRPEIDEEDQGLDIADHGERAYNY